MELQASAKSNDRFVVAFLPKNALKAANAEKPWEALKVAPTHGPFTITVQPGQVGSTKLTINLTGSQVRTGIYDITIVAKRDGGPLDTLINLKNDFNLDRSPTDLAGNLIVGMGALREGNAVNDPRADVELSTIINALDASALATSLNKDLEAIVGEPTYDASLDFNRDGKVNASDLELLKKNYLEFSPVLIQ